MLLIKRNVFFTLFVIFVLGCTGLKSGFDREDAQLENQENAQFDAGQSSSSATSPYSTARSSDASKTDAITEATEPIYTSEAVEVDGCSKLNFYFDNDGDGFGDPDSSILSC
ncbi:MAG: hypothetical protein JXA30_01125, partial [Deltaproteobacteria bacterium]|nr:hypothetical protein [Deltaproteobacteria bacterium]